MAEFSTPYAYLKLLCSGCWAVWKMVDGSVLLSYTNEESCGYRGQYRSGPALELQGSEQCCQIELERVIH